MTHAIFLTAYDRPDLLEKTLESWSRVRGLQDWHFEVWIEPSHREREIMGIVRRWIAAYELKGVRIVLNPRVYGVLHHPWVGFEKLFTDYGFVVRAEDDLLVSDDILDYFTWAEITYRNRQEIGSVHGYSGAPERNRSPAGVEINPGFNPWVWGTWRDRWTDVIGPTWDHDYSTFNVSPGNQSGWDWNLNTRIYPERGLSGVYPKLSRVDNIGIYGVHGTPENHVTAETFQPVYGVHDYRET